MCRKQKKKELHLDIEQLFLPVFHVRDEPYMKDLPPRLIERYTIMIRVFKQFFKINYKILTALDFFNASIKKINIYDYACPFCHTKHPDWKRHADYERQLIAFENGQVVCHRVIIIRYKCDSCGHTHAILPESIIPYQSYSFLFILAVLNDYFLKSLTVEAICDKYSIPASTLYSWKKLLLRHKKQWLGLLKDENTSVIHFLELLQNDLLYRLKEFYTMSHLSFFQGVIYRRKARSSPV